MGEYLGDLRSIGDGEGCHEGVRGGAGIEAASVGVALEVNNCSSCPRAAMASYIQARITKGQLRCLTIMQAPNSIISLALSRYNYDLTSTTMRDALVYECRNHDSTSLYKKFNRVRK